VIKTMVEVAITAAIMASVVSSGMVGEGCGVSVV